ncbi:TonB-dependent siderophore receptor [Psychromonas aquatilis]|uniref:TonB-dependent siderophore receptor n=1 Tax=Psychromonas aquatilis TaxID=2005072 RepID=A0ABU9GM09_9GAMM
MKKHYSHSILALSIASALAASHSVTAAEESIQSDTIDTMTIMGKTYRNTATKTALEPEETPQAINIIDNQQLEIRGVKTLGETLKYTPGITTNNYGSEATFLDVFNIRGFNVSQSYYNGVSLQSLSGWNLQPQIDPIALQQVEVFKGPTSVLYGAMPPGGMVNLIGKSPQVESNTIISASIGTDDLKEFSIDSAGQIGDSDFNYRFVGLARQYDTQTSLSGNERYVIAPSIDWNISDKTLLNVNLYYQNDPEVGNNTSMPESVLVDNDSDYSIGDKNWNETEREFLLAGYKFQHEFENSLTYMQNFRYMKANFKQKNSYSYSYDQTTGDIGRAFYSTEEDSEGFVFDNQLSADITTGDVYHSLLVGADIQKLDGNAEYATYGVSTFNTFTPDNDMVDPSTFTKSVYSDDNIHSKQVGLYAQDQLQWGSLIVIAGLRYDHYESNGTSYGANYEVDESNLSYRVGALYELDNGVSPFVSYATSFEPLNTSGYEPELGEQVELGLKYMSDDESISGSVALFNIVKSNVVTVDPTTVGSGTYSYVQIGEVRSRGVEFDSKFQLTDSLDLAANYTYLDVEVTKDTLYEGTTPLYNPEHSASLWANYVTDEGIFRGSKVGAGVRYVGEMQKNTANTQGMVPDYTIVDLSLGYELGNALPSLEGASADLIVSNLFDTDSYTCYDEDSCWNNEDRSIELKVNYTF